MNIIAGIPQVLNDITCNELAADLLFQPLYMWEGSPSSNGRAPLSFHRSFDGAMAHKIIHRRMKADLLSARCRHCGRWVKHIRDTEESFQSTLKAHFLSQEHSRGVRVRAMFSLGFWPVSAFAMHSRWSDIFLSSKFYGTRSAWLPLETIIAIKLLMEGLETETFTELSDDIAIVLWPPIDRLPTILESDECERLREWVQRDHGDKFRDQVAQWNREALWTPACSLEYWIQLFAYHYGLNSPIEGFWLRRSDLDAAATNPLSESHEDGWRSSRWLEITENDERPYAMSDWENQAP